jgi:hypothetical protein
MSRTASWRRNALEQARIDVNEVMDSGHKVIMYTDFHWKIDGIDVWPSALKYMKGGVIRRYEKLSDIFP